MRATDIEFRYRFWFIGGLFWAAFSCYWIDATSLGVWLAGALSRSAAGTAAWQSVYRILGWLAVVMVGTVAVLRTWSTAYLHRTVVHDAAMHSEGLVADGPYRYVRNPIYLGNFLLVVSFGFMASRLGFLALLLGMTVLTLRLIGREEAGLLASQGEPYRRFCATVPRLIPSLRPRLPASGALPNWRQAVIGEAWVCGFVAAAAGYALTQRMRIYSLVMASSLALYAVVYYTDRRQKEPA